MDAVRIFGELAAQRHKAALQDYADYPAYHQLKKMGLIQDSGVVQSLCCNECDHPHDAAVVYDVDRYGYFCPELGFVEKDRAEIAAVQTNVSGFIGKLAADLNCKRRKSSPVAGNTWRVGAIESQAGDISVYFHPVLRDASDLNVLKSALAMEVKGPFGVVLTALGALSIAPFTTVALENCISFDQTSGKFCVSANIEAMVGVPQIKTGGRPNIYKSNIENIMIARSREGRSLLGRNEEAKGILGEYRTHFPSENVPSSSAVKRYVTEIRRGS